jgi:hypothetical protein
MTLVDYHTSRPDIVVCLITSQTGIVGPTDYILEDWEQAGLLRKPVKPNPLGLGYKGFSTASTGWVLTC